MRISSTSMGARPGPTPAPPRGDAARSGFAARLERAHQKSSGDGAADPSPAPPESHPTGESGSVEADAPSPGLDEPGEEPEAFIVDDEPGEEPDAFDAPDALLEPGWSPAAQELCSRAKLGAKQRGAPVRASKGALHRPGVAFGAVRSRVLSLEHLDQARIRPRAELQGALAKVEAARALLTEASASLSAPEEAALVSRAARARLAEATPERTPTFAADAPAQHELAGDRPDTRPRGAGGGAHLRSEQGGSPAKDLPGQAAEIARSGENFPPPRGGEAAPGGSRRPREEEVLGRLHLVLGQAPGGAVGASGTAKLRGALERATTPQELAHKVQMLQGRASSTARAVVELGPGRQVALRVRQHRGVMMVSLEASSAELAHQLGQHLQELTRALESSPAGRGRLELDGAVVAEWTGRSGEERQQRERRHAAPLHGGGAAGRGAQAERGPEAEVLETVQRVLTTGTLHIVT